LVANPKPTPVHCIYANCTIQSKNLPPFICFGFHQCTNSRKNWRILLLNRSEIGTTNALQCQVLVWWNHIIGPRTTKNGNNYCTELKRTMGRSTHGNLVQWVNLQKRRRACSSYSHYPSYVISSAVAGCCSTSALTILPIDRFCTRFSCFLILQFFQPLVHAFYAPRSSQNFPPSICLCWKISRNLFARFVLNNTITTPHKAKNNGAAYHYL